MRTIHLRLRARLRRARSASAAMGTASAFVVAAALLSFVPDAPTARDAAWTLRGMLPADPVLETGAEWAPARDAAGVRGVAKPV